MIKSVWKFINIIEISHKRGMEQAEIIDTFWTYQGLRCISLCKDLFPYNAKQSSCCSVEKNLPTRVHRWCSPRWQWSVGSMSVGAPEHGEITVQQAFLPL